MTAHQFERSDFHWPQGLYESAPFVYMVAGLWVTFRLDGPVAAIASAFLTLAGLGILYLRWTYRRLASASLIDAAAARPASFDTPPPAASAYLGNEPYASSQRLVAAATHGERDLLESLIRDVLAKLETRYRRQENLLRGSDPAAAGERWREHQALSAKISELHSAHIAGKLTRQTLIECIVYEAIVDRTAGEQGEAQRAFLA